MLALSLEMEVLALTEEASKVPTDTSENFQTHEKNMFQTAC